MNWGKPEDEQLETALLTENVSGDFPSLGGPSEVTKKKPVTKSEPAPKKEQEPIKEAPKKETAPPKEEKKKEETPKKDVKNQPTSESKSAISKPVGLVPEKPENKILSGWALPGKQKKEPEKKENKEKGYNDEFPSL